MKPYFEEDGITIYHGDCREVLPQLETADLVLSDPPYGISYSPGGGGKGWCSKTYTGDDLVIGDDIPFEPDFLLGFERLHFVGWESLCKQVASKPDMVRLVQKARYRTL